MLDDILPQQMRAARALIGWKREDLATAAGITLRNLVRIETAKVRPRARTVAAIRSALEQAGVQFIPENGGGAGVRLKTPAARN